MEWKDATTIHELLTQEQVKEIYEDNERGLRDPIECPKCGEKWYSLADKAFIKFRDKCYPCSDELDEDDLFLFLTQLV